MLLLSPFHHAFICEVHPVAISKKTIHSWKPISLCLGRKGDKKVKLLGDIPGSGIQIV